MKNSKGVVLDLSLLKQSFLDSLKDIPNGKVIEICLSFNLKGLKKNLEKSIKNFTSVILFPEIVGLRRKLIFVESNRRLLLSNDGNSTEEVVLDKERIVEELSKKIYFVFENKKLKEEFIKEFRTRPTNEIDLSKIVVEKDSKGKAIHFLEKGLLLKFASSSSINFPFSSQGTEGIEKNFDFLFSHLNSFFQFPLMKLRLILNGISIQSFGSKVKRIF